LKTRPLTILVSPLDWGLGHASRMIPLIGRFIHDGHHVILAGSGRSAELLRNTFPALRFVSIPCHTVHLGPGKHSYFQLVLQLPALVLSVFREHRMTRRIVRQEAVDIIISDNRYGIRTKKAFSVLITHQVSPVLPAVFRWLESPLYLIIRGLIQRFDRCWIPDYADPAVNLSGRLSHRYKLPSNAQFIGVLSRFTHQGNTDETPSTFCYDLAVVLSGPEPQVSVFEKKIYSQLIRLQKSAILIRGMRNKPLESLTLPMIHQFSHLEINAFSQVLKQAGCVISRSGYSAIMDYVSLGISAVLVPTPGQSEQEYLAGWLGKKGWFTVIKEDELDLAGIPYTRLLHQEAGNPLIPAKNDFKFVEDLYREYHRNGN
jgi:UDP:flavonoid glycosyltransferase YjiC (YdhE family)